MGDERLKGIYGYFDTLKCKIIYIGKDSNIEKKKRHKEHYQPSQYNVQQINRVLQNDKVNRYRYVEFDKNYYDDNILNEKEIYWISYFEPLFNFTNGGEGISGYKHTEEICKKISEAHKGKPKSEEHRKKLNEAKKGRTLTEEHCKKISESKKGKLNGEKNPNWNPEARVIKAGIKYGKQQYALKYNGKKIKYSINKKKTFKRNGNIK